MDESTYEQVSEGNRPAPFLAGLLLGSLTGAVAMLFFAPESGKVTRQKIQQKVIELRDQTAATVEGAVAQVRTKAGQIKADVSDKANELKQQGQDVLVEQLDRVSAAAKTGKKAIKGKAS
jgi:gas vesicle protein